MVCGGGRWGWAGGSAPPYGALWRRCRALRSTHSAGRPTEGPRPTPWSKNPRSANPPARRLCCCVLHTLIGPTLLHAAASCCVDATLRRHRPPGSVRSRGRYGYLMPDHPARQMPMGAGRFLGASSPGRLRKYSFACSQIFICLCLRLFAVVGPPGACIHEQCSVYESRLRSFVRVPSW